MALDDELMQQLLAIFEVELAEQIELITVGLLALENSKALDNSKNIQDMLRYAHTIKGSSKGVGIANIVEMIHRFESILSALDKKKLQSSSALLDLLLETLDSIQAAFVAEKNKQATPFDLLALLTRLDEALDHKIENNGGKKELPSLNKALQHKVDNRVEEKEPVPRVLESAKPVDKLAAPEEVLEQTTSYLVSEELVKHLSGTSEDLQISSLQVKALLSYIQSLSSDLANLNSDFSELMLAENISEERDKLSGLMQKLSQLSHQTMNSYNEKRPFFSHYKNLMYSLETSINSLRLVSFESLLTPLYRIVRDVSQQQNKQVRLSVTGSGIKIDRSLYQLLHAPLVHLINNAIDHGIESAELREEKRKPAQAELQLQITQQANLLILYLKDDGRGVDPELVKQTVLDKQLMTEVELKGLGTQQLIELIFRTGFSSAKMISNISGRGVGLDIVKSNLRKIKGSAHVSSTLGQGTQFTLTLPSMLGSEQGLVISVAEQQMIMPAYAIEWVKEVQRSQFNYLNGQMMLLNKHEQPVSAFDLSELLGIRSDRQETSLFSTLFISNGDIDIALIVDEIIGEQEIIIKAFEYPLIKVPYAIGMSTLVTGQLTPVLSSDALMNKAISMRGQAKNHQAEEQQETEQKRALVVDDSITTRTLECNILRREGFAVTAFVNGLEAWQELQNNNQYDLILSDVEMPLLNGFELVEKIKNDASLSSIPTIIVTSLDSEDDKKRGVQVGANAYICKDQLNTESLLTIINQLI